MKPVSLLIREFRGWRDSGPLDLSKPVTLVVGDNAGGKSSTLAAVEWCLFGRAVESFKESGIREREDWEVRARQAGRLPTEVVLTLVSGADQFTVSRRRYLGAGRTAPDEVEVTGPAGLRHEGGEAEAWIRERLADLETYRRAHALHPEIVRRRATDTAERNAALGTLLGLDAAREARGHLKGTAAASLVTRADERLRGLERDLAAVAERPRKERDDVERRLAERGVRRETLSPALAGRLRETIFARAAALASRLEIAAEVPATTDAQVREWGVAWPSRARGKTPALAAMMPLRHSHGLLEAALARLAPLDAGLERARVEFDAAVKAGGDKDARARAQVAAEKKLEEAAASLKKVGELAALLRDAQPFVPESEPSPSCPVCTTPVAGLSARIEESLARLEGPESATLAKAREEAQVAVRAAQKAVGDLERLFEAGTAARRARDKTREELSALLPPASGPEPRDLAAVARARLEEQQRKIAALEALVRERDESLDAHARDMETLRDLEAWSSAVARLDRDVEATRCTSWPALEKAVDAAAGFAADVEALSAMAREAEAERSTKRTEEANVALAAYFDLIQGGEGRGLRVHCHQTPKGLEYQLRDGRDKLALPTLNQAAMNAVSLSMLFAQAEERSRAGGLSWVLLDDPIQSLDDKRQEGLAAALERLSGTCCVLVGCTESAFVDRVRDFVSRPRALLHLGPRDDERGTFVASRDER